MKILVLSDSHKAKDNILKAVEIEKPDMVFHIGDHEKDCLVIETKYPEIGLRTVRGNCDGWALGLDIDEFELQDKRFFMTHGHLYGVKTGMDSIIHAAHSRNADVLLYGHTHIQYYEVIDGLTILNPGSVGDAKKSYAVLELEKGKMHCELKNLE